MVLPFTPPDVSEELRGRLARKRPKLLRLNYFAVHIHEVQRAETPLAKLSQRAREKWGFSPHVADWPCGSFASVVRALTDPLDGPVGSISRLFRDIAIVEHLREGRDMRAELADHFRGQIPFGFVAIAVEAGRVGVLRPFGVRPGRNGVSADDIRYANRLFDIAEEVYDEMRLRFAREEIAWPCHWCGRPHLQSSEGYCCLQCQSSDERRTAYVRRRDTAEHRRS